MIAVALAAGLSPPYREKNTGERGFAGYFSLAPHFRGESRRESARMARVLTATLTCSVPYRGINRTIQGGV